MKEKQLRTFIVDEKEVIFDIGHFKELFLKHAAKKGIGIGNYEDEVAEALYIDKSAVHNWRMGVNGPGDIEKIQTLAKLWNIKYEKLLMEVNTMTELKENEITRECAVKTKLSDRERTALKNVYCSFVNYMDIFEKTGGFLWNEDLSDYNINIAYNLYGQLKKTLELEYVDLKGSVYDSLSDFYDGELTRSLEGCFIPEDGDTYESQCEATTMEKANLMNTFKSIIDPYL